jgi:hypothetical protein
MKNFLPEAKKPLSAAFFHQPIMGRLAVRGKNSYRTPKEKQRGGEPRCS